MPETEVRIYTQEEIEELKLMGMDKPPSVSWGDWMGPKKHSHVHDLLIHMAAAGATNAKIAEELDYTQSRVSIILGNSEIKRKVRELQEKFWGLNAQKRFDNLLPQAIDVAEGVLNNEQEKTSLRADVAFKLMDRALGKPTQTTEIKGNLIADLLHRLDQVDKLDPIDVTDSEKLDKPKDKLDNFIDSFIPKETVVGKKDKIKD